MKIFIDSGDTNEIREAQLMGLVDGVTTNPSLAAKSGKPFKQLILEICEIVDGPISAEVVSLKADEMVKEGKDIASWHKNIIVKVPLIPEGLKAVRQFTAMGIKTNVTLCFNANQALLAAKAGATYVSPFVGRLDDISTDGMLEGPNIGLYKKLIKRFPKLKVVASGGVSCLNDLEELKYTKVYGVIIGKAIYEGKIKLEELKAFHH